MIRLHKVVRRRTHATVFSKGEYREVIVSVVPPSVLTFRLAGSRCEYSLPIEACYWTALQAHLASERPKRKVKIERGAL